jgi:hypothetical protein
MKTRSYLFLLGLISFVLAVGLACNALSGTPTQPATQPPQTQPAPATQSNNITTDTPNSSALVTFTDQNKFYQIEVPGDWKYSQTKDTKNNYYYIDTFTSPDGNAVIENITYDDGTAFAGSDESKFGLYLLNTFYSKTGKEGDIKVTEEKPQSDGSDRLTWYSKAGGYTGLSFLEIRKGTTFLMFTVNWNNDYKDTYLDTLNQVIASYVVP